MLVNCLFSANPTRTGCPIRGKNRIMMFRECLCDILEYISRLLINNYELLQPLSVQITLIVGKKFVNTIFQLFEAFQF